MLILPRKLSRIKKHQIPADLWKTVRTGHSCAAVSSYDSPPEKRLFRLSQSTSRLVKAGAEASSVEGKNLESEYLPAGLFTSHFGGCRQRERNFIAKVKIDISALAFDKINRKTKPPGSLGLLEIVAVRLAILQETLEPRLSKKRICVYASSHGVASEAVSAYPTEVTAQMVLNFVSGGAAINALARHGAIDLHIIDAGVDTDWPESVLRMPDFYFRSVRRGTSNFYREPAMSEGECQQALEIGREQVRDALEDGIDLLGIGEMGIGNTTAASALLVALCGLKPAQAVGRGTGIDDGALQRKVEVVAGAYKRYSPAFSEPAGLYWLRAVGGFEIAAMAGTLLEAARARLPVVVDGFIATAAAAAAFSIDQNCREVCFFSHRSSEQAHGKALEALKVEPLLDLKMRLGEGTGAALAMPILEAATKIFCEMATFESAGVSGPLAKGASR